ncbi:MAG: alpha-glucan family phosphorylase [Proteobacteria bacterium]|nr:alpha-glucan family phosphorylase [Pseudomonadota bacterium]
MNKKQYIKNDRPHISYFSMEIGITHLIPTYSGGLGILAGDTIKAAADLKVPLIGITLLTKKGYFEQDIDSEGNQIEKESDFKPESIMTPTDIIVDVSLEGRKVYINPWIYTVKSPIGGEVPIFYLDTDIPENNERDRKLCHYLYGGDNEYRFKQEVILGIGGIRVLKELGLEIRRYHMNEGHSALLTVELLNDFKRSVEEVWDEDLIWDTEAVRDRCVFTTHTPVEAGHDKFDYDLVQKILREDYIPLKVLKRLGGEDKLNMTLLAMNLSEFVNGVAKKHGEVSRKLFPGYEISAITNGVHSFTWVSKHMAKVYDKYIPGWANEPELFVRAENIPDDEIYNAHLEAKKELFDYIKQETGEDFDLNILTIGFARRATAYKRPDLLFSNIERLIKIAGGKVQFVYGGKAHPKDFPGKEIIKKIIKLSKELKKDIKIVYLKNYNMAVAKMLVAGVDVWLNTPKRPLEASGTSGMKSAHNGVINFSILDGWWIEGHIEDVTGWSIGSLPSEVSLEEDTDDKDAEDLYNKLENKIIPVYYNDKSKWIYIMKNSIGKIAYYFNTHRMMRRYVTEAYIC